MLHQPLRDLDGFYARSSLQNRRKCTDTRTGTALLLETNESLEVGLGQEKQLTEKYEMEFVHYPIPDRGLPNSVQDYLAFTKRLYHESAGGLNTVVHCRAGIGRAGIVAAGVLLHCGFDPLEAIEHISKQRGVAVPDTQEQIDWVVKSYAAMPNTDARTYSWLKSHIKHV